MGLLSSGPTHGLDGVTTGHVPYLYTLPRPTFYLVVYLTTYLLCHCSGGVLREVVLTYHVSTTGWLSDVGVQLRVVEWSGIQASFVEESKSFNWRSHFTLCGDSGSYRSLCHPLQFPSGKIGSRRSL